MQAKKPVNYSQSFAILNYLLLYEILFFAARHLHGLFSSSFAQTADQHGLVWFTDVAKAQQASVASHKPIFAFFTGSDWCGWCHKLEADVFAKSEFIAWAKQKVILLELDFPRNKQLAPELAAQNNSLQQAFNVRGYPTIWIFNLAKDTAANKMNISAFGSLGYPSEAERGKEQVKFLHDADLILANKKS